MKTVSLQSSVLSRAVALLGIASLATAACLIASPAHAQNTADLLGTTDHAMGDHHGGRGADMMQRRMGRMLDKIGASPEQKQKIADIANIAKQQSGDMKANHERHTKARSDMAAALSAPTIDKATVERLRAEGIANHDTQSKKRTQMMLDIAAVLSPEQRVKMREMMEKRGGREGGRGWGHGMGDKGADRGPTPGSDKPAK